MKIKGRETKQVTKIFSCEILSNTTLLGTEPLCKFGGYRYSFQRTFCNGNYFFESNLHFIISDIYNTFFFYSGA
jgi:hypothetical protein